MRNYPACFRSYRRRFPRPLMRDSASCAGLRRVRRKPRSARVRQEFSEKTPHTGKRRSPYGDCRNGEKGSGQSPFPFSSHRGSGKTAFPMTAYRQGIAAKSLYYIEIHGIRAAPDAPRGGVFAPLIKFYAWLTGFYARLTKFYASLTKFYAPLAKFYAPLTKFFASLAGPCE